MRQEDQEIAYDDAAILNVQQPASLDCDEFGLLKTKRLPPLPEAATDNWTSRSTTPNEGCSVYEKDVSCLEQWFKPYDWLELVGSPLASLITNPTKPYPKVANQN
uniref:Uncharacterized protein n=1 Tax=Fagus sylvatica TaxID=28930 RepID=A0A2N9GZZ8_FAGSY